MFPLILSFGLFSCQWREEYVRAKQIRTFADMQTISARIEAARLNNGGIIAKRQARRIVEDVNGGLDAWGNAIIYFYGEGDRGATFLLISYGSDGRPDVDDYSEYFEVSEPRDIRGQAGHDIVFRGETPLTLAGK